MPTLPRHDCMIAGRVGRRRARYLVVYLCAAENSTGPRIEYNAPVTSPCKGAML
jgi:hypothetical protein